MCTLEAEVFSISEGLCTNMSPPGNSTMSVGYCYKAGSRYLDLGCTSFLGSYPSLPWVNMGKFKL